MNSVLNTAVTVWPYLNEEGKYALWSLGNGIDYSTFCKDMDLLATERNA